jgi:hypothetical protein
VAVSDTVDVVAGFCARIFYNTFISSGFLVCCGPKNHMSFHFAVLELKGSAKGKLIVVVDCTCKFDNKEAVKGKAFCDIV